VVGKGVDHSVEVGDVLVCGPGPSVDDQLFTDVRRQLAKACRLQIALYDAKNSASSSRDMIRLAGSELFVVVDADRVEDVVR
jgi:hypothetical protein